MKRSLFFLKLIGVATVMSLTACKSSQVPQETQVETQVRTGQSAPAKVVVPQQTEVETKEQEMPQPLPLPDSLRNELNKYE